MATAMRGRRKSDLEPWRETLIEQFKHLPRLTANLVKRTLSPSVEVDDLIGAGNAALCAAARRFDPSRGVQFTTYAIQLIRGAMLEMLRCDDWVPRTVRDHQGALRRCESALAGRLGRAATDEEIAADLGITVAALGRWRGQVVRAQTLSLDHPLQSENGDKLIKDFIRDTLPGPEEQVVAADEQDTIRRAIESLPEREALVMRLYYYDNKTLREIGEILDISESRTFQLRAQALTRLRRYLRTDAGLD